MAVWRAPSEVNQNRGQPVSNFELDANGNPAGGYSTGDGFGVTWQNGVGEPNGAVMEDLIEVVLQRLRWFQTAADGKFACRENALAITALESGQDWLYRRTRNRLDRGVEGTYNK